MKFMSSLPALFLASSMILSGCNSEKKDEDEASALTGSESTTCRVDLGGFIMCTAYNDISAVLKAEINPEYTTEAASSSCSETGGTFSAS